MAVSLFRDRLAIIIFSKLQQTIKKNIEIGIPTVVSKLNTYFGIRHQIGQHD